MKVDGRYHMIEKKKKTAAVCSLPLCEISTQMNAPCFQ